MRKLFVLICCLCLLTACATWPPETSPEPEPEPIVLQTMPAAYMSEVSFAYPDTWIKAIPAGFLGKAVYLDHREDLFHIEILLQDKPIMVLRLFYVATVAHTYQAYVFGKAQVFPHDTYLVQGAPHLFQEEDGTLTGVYYLEAALDFERPVVFIVISFKAEDREQVVVEILPFLQSFTDIETLPDLPSVDDLKAVKGKDVTKEDVI